jgi:thiamine biosynthesis lipoprotein
MKARPISRRRALVILAAAAAVPGSLLAAQAQPFEWRGLALGADARLVLWAQDKRHAQKAIDACVAEIERLEQIFSLYRTSSEISRLNRTGSLKAPSHDMVSLLHLSRKMNAATQGLFDPTVQPLWQFLSKWYSSNRTRTPPSGEDMAGVRSLIGMEKIALPSGEIICRDGARITLNGIAQGYITDRVAELLRSMGWGNVLIDLGEVRALDGKPDGSPWRINIRETGQSLPLTSAALATSSGSVLTFDGSGATTHILNPLTGGSSPSWRAVSVQHPSAAVADALSTALFVASPEQLEIIANSHKDARIWATRSDGTNINFGT